eukprot:gene43480-54003_t
MVFLVSGEIALPNYRSNLVPVADFQVTSVEGRWFQMYTSLIPDNTFEKDGFCILADVSKSKDDPLTLSIDASVSLKSKTASPKLISGTVTSVKPGIFTATYLGRTIDMLVIATGDVPKTGSKQYPWMIISDNARVNLFIVASDVDVFKSQYKSAVLKLVKEKGFTLPTNKPIETFQSKSECKYPPLPSKK